MCRAGALQAWCSCIGSSVCSSAPHTPRRIYELGLCIVNDQDQPESHGFRAASATFPTLTAAHRPQAAWGGRLLVPTKPHCSKMVPIPDSCRLCRHQDLQAPTCLRASASCSCVCDSSCRLAATETAALSSSAVALSSFSCAAALAAASAAVVPSCCVSLACKRGAAQRYIELRVQFKEAPHVEGRCQLQV